MKTLERVVQASLLFLLFYGLVLWIGVRILVSSSLLLVALTFCWPCPYLAWSRTLKHWTRLISNVYRQSSRKTS